MNRSFLVLDSFAIMVYLQKESGSKKITEYLTKANKKSLSLMMSRINWGEVFYAVFRSNGPKVAEETLLIMEQLPIEIIEITKELVYDAALFKGKYPIAYADCFAAALAKHKQCPLITGDREFKHLEKEVRIEWL